MFVMEDKIVEHFYSLLLKSGRRLHICAMGFLLSLVSSCLLFAAVTVQHEVIPYELMTFTGNCTISESTFDSIPRFSLFDNGKCIPNAI